MEKKLEYLDIMDYVAECYGLNKALGAFTVSIIQENKHGQCMFDVGLVLDDMATMMHRYSIDGDQKIAGRKVHYPAVEKIMDNYLQKRVEYIKGLENK